MKEIIILIILIILLTPIKVQIINNKHDNNKAIIKYKNNINLYLFSFLNIRIDIDEILEKFFKGKKLTLKEIKTQYKKMTPYKEFFINVLNQIEISKISISCTSSNEYLYVLYWNIITVINSITKVNFLYIRDSSYNVTYDLNQKNKINYDIVLTFRVIYFILAYIISVKNIILNKRKGSVNNARTSDKRVIQNING